MGDWIGDVKQGGSVNFKNIFFNPHGNGTHTECVGHISKEDYSINKLLTKFFFIAQVITVDPEKINGDFVITTDKLGKIERGTEAIVIRTLPNDDSKNQRHYSNTNPPYIHHEATEYIRISGIKHLLIDLPSVDKEKDDGKLLAHKAFWNYPSAPILDATITEFIYVPSEIKDGTYLLNIQIASFENDASPSKPVLYKLF
jgi:arylformamidase